MALRRPVTPTFDPPIFDMNDPRHSPVFDPSIFDMEVSHQSPTLDLDESPQTPIFDPATFHLDASHSSPLFDPRIFDLDEPPIFNLNGPHERSFDSMAPSITSTANETPSGDGMLSNSFMPSSSPLTEVEHLLGWESPFDLRTSERIVPQGEGRPSRIERHPESYGCICSIAGSDRIYPFSTEIPSRANVPFTPDEDCMNSEESFPRFTSAKSMPYLPDQNMANDSTTPTSSQNNISALTGQLSNLSTTDNVSTTTSLDTWDIMPFRFRGSHTGTTIIHRCNDHVHYNGPKWRRKHPNRPCTYEPTRPELITLPFRNRRKLWKPTHGERSCLRADEGRNLQRLNNRFDPLSSLSRHRAQSRSPPRDDGLITRTAARPLYDRAVEQSGEEDRFLLDELEDYEREESERKRKRGKGEGGKGEEEGREAEGGDRSGVGEGTEAPG